MNNVCLVYYIMNSDEGMDKQSFLILCIYVIDNLIVKMISLFFGACYVSDQLHLSYELGCSLDQYLCLSKNKQLQSSKYPVSSAECGLFESVLIGSAVKLAKIKGAEDV